MLAAVREKVAEDAEAGTVTAGGALRIGLFSEIVTETLLVTAADRATVQVEVLPEVIVAGVHARAWRVCTVGIFLALSVPAVAWIQESAVLLMVGVLLVALVGVAFWWMWRRESKRL